MHNILSDKLKGGINGVDNANEASKSSHLIEQYRNLAIGLLAATSLSGCAIGVIPDDGRYNNHGDYYHRDESGVIIIRRPPPPPPPRKIIIIEEERHRGRKHGLHLPHLHR